MLASRCKRLAELERSLAATHEQVTSKQLKAVWAQFSDADIEVMVASIERREQPGYVLTAEDEAIERHWYEAVQAVVPEAEQVRLSRRQWALAWCEAVKSHA